MDQDWEKYQMVNKDEGIHKRNIHISKSFEEPHLTSSLGNFIRNNTKIQKIHINPNFRRQEKCGRSRDVQSEFNSVHLNPYFFKSPKDLRNKSLGLDTRKKNLVHINPKLVCSSQYHATMAVTSLKDKNNPYHLKEEHSVKNTEVIHPPNIPSDVPPTKCLYTWTKNKTVQELNKKANIINPQTQHVAIAKSRKYMSLQLFKTKVNSNTSLPSGAKSYHISTKFSRPMVQHLKNKYKYISRSQRIVSSKKFTATKSPSAIFASKTKLINKSHLKALPSDNVEISSTSNVHQKRPYFITKHQCLERNMSHCPKYTLVKLGGILYKCTSNKLTCTKVRKRNTSCSKDQFNSNLKHLKTDKNHNIVYVRGEKFILDKSRKTLIRQTNLQDADQLQKNIKRVDFGGVTYVQKTNNVLIQTNTHHARFVLNQAKQRSIALLSSLRKRNNMPCVIYHKFGRCMRHNKGLCPYIHDSKNISLCKKYLKGDCENKNCLLSHELVQEKMATCHFFLEGRCDRENCPYLHVKVNKKAAICRNFLQGFCKLAQNCKKRHLHLCPEFEKGSCPKGNKCPYPHERKHKHKSITPLEMQEVKCESKVKDCRNAIQNNKRNKLHTVKTKINKGTDEKFSDGEDEECVPKKVKLEKLPCYIPLESAQKKV